MTSLTQQALNHLRHTAEQAQHGTVPRTLTIELALAWLALATGDRRPCVAYWRAMGRTGPRSNPHQDNYCRHRDMIGALHGIERAIAKEWRGKYDSHGDGEY